LICSSVFERYHHREECYGDLERIQYEEDLLWRWAISNQSRACGTRVRRGHLLSQ
jgi:hypothetical protein